MGLGLAGLSWAGLGWALVERGRGEGRPGGDHHLGPPSEYGHFGECPPAQLRPSESGEWGAGRVRRQKEAFPTAQLSGFSSFLCMPPFLGRLGGTLGAGSGTHLHLFSLANGRRWHKEFPRSVVGTLSHFLLVAPGCVARPEAWWALRLHKAKGSPPWRQSVHPGRLRPPCACVGAPTSDLCL